MPAAPLICCRNDKAHARHRRDQRTLFVRKTLADVTEFSLCHRMLAWISSSSCCTSAMLSVPRRRARALPASSARSCSNSQRGLEMMFVSWCKITMKQGTKPQWVRRSLRFWQHRSTDEEENRGHKLHGG